MLENGERRNNFLNDLHPIICYNVIMKKLFLVMPLLTMTITIALTIVTPNAFASEGGSAIACEADGYEAGQNEQFIQGL
jgi:hypothetical protein